MAGALPSVHGPSKRALQRGVQNELARAVLAGTVRASQTATVDWFEGPGYVVGVAESSDGVEAG